ncbi:hypothetical protein B0H19DRAFT_1178699 [Mycena capillaripes]|nr:hypothetical protein B0H19DRAFT_1178699 [Mycena capillaripes]
MDDSPPPAYSKEYKRPVAVSVAASYNPNGTETPNVSKRAEGRGSFPRPLPRLPAGQLEDPSLKGTVSPLRLHKKSQSTAIPSISERPWKPPSLDGAPPGSKWDPAVPNPPQFRHREAEFAQHPSSHLKYPGPPPPTPIYSRSAAHFPTTPAPNRGREISFPDSGVSQVDPNSFYNPAVSGLLSRPSRPTQPRGNLLNIRPNQAPSINSSSASGRVRWES